MSIFLKFSGKSFALSLDENLQKELIQLFQSFNINSQTISYQCNGKVLNNFKNLQKYDTILAFTPLLGGKGGYGAKLKNQGGKKVKPNDNKFSRDAHGRRIQYQMAQKQYTQFIKKKMEEDQNVNKAREQYKVMQQTMKDGHSFMKMDKKYNQEVQQAENKLAESIRIGRQRLLQKKQLGNRLKQEEQKQQLNNEQEKKQMTHNDCEKIGKKQDDQCEKMQNPIKKVKLNQNQQKKVQQPAALISAKDKLKSLFKK